MKVHLIKRLTIEDYSSRHPRSKIPFTIWLNTIRYADWNKPEDILGSFASADILGKGSDRVIFNIGGNRNRMICKYYFGENEVLLFVKWVGSHSEYDKLCNGERQYTVNDY